MSVGTGVRATPGGGALPGLGLGPFPLHSTRPSLGPPVLAWLQSLPLSMDDSYIQSLS